MRQENFHFELRDNTLALATALNDIIISRFKDNSRTEIDNKIDVRFVYGPKKRVIYDIVNAAKATTLPVVALDLKGFSHDTSRIFNKNAEFYDKVTSNNSCVQYLTPTPIKLSYNITIITRYRSDMEQIISNIIPYCNPYFVISIKVPDDFKLLKEQEIRETVTWDGNINIEHSEPIDGKAKSIFTATTNFTVNGWLFKPNQPAAKPIFEINNTLSDTLVDDWVVDTLHVESYPYINYICINDIPQVTLNPNYIAGESPISELYTPNMTCKIHVNSEPSIAIIGNGLIHNNKFILTGDAYSLKQIGDYNKIDLSNISSNKTPISILKRGLVGVDITDKITFNKNNIATFKMPNNLNTGDYKLYTYNDAGLSNAITLQII